MKPGPGTGEAGTRDPGLGTWDSGLGTWDLGLGTWDPGLGKNLAPSSSPCLLQVLLCGGSKSQGHERTLAPLLSPGPGSRVPGPGSRLH
ncbi:hypothetical protein D9R12_09250 [Pseudoxanthomonas spadix]|nr:hypothetical protein D9R12_09250 [Pseudoxanthomonas spadix]